MKFTHSYISNAEYFKLINHSDIHQDINDVIHYIFIPVLLHRQSSIWDSFDSGNIQPLCSWLNHRIHITKLSLKSLCLKPFPNTKVVLLVDPYALANDQLKSLVLSLVHISIGSSYLHSSLLPICTREGSDLTLFEMYSTIVSPLIREYLNKNFKPNVFNVVSRLDSDDLFISEYCKTLRLVALSLKTSTLRSVTNQILADFPLGFQYDLSDSHAYKTLWPENTFASLIYTPSDTNNIDQLHVPYSYAHDNIPSDLIKLTVSTLLPQWVQVCHDNNVSNSLFPWSLPPQKIILASLIKDILSI